MAAGALGVRHVYKNFSNSGEAFLGGKRARCLFYCFRDLAEYKLTILSQISVDENDLAEYSQFILSQISKCPL